MTTLPTMPSSTPRAARTTIAALLLLLAAGCNGADTDGPDLRGGGHRAAALDAGQRARVYAAALRQAFDVDSALVLALDPALLPRNGSFARDSKIDAGTVRALRATGTTRGSCEPPAWDGPRAPRCDAAAPGYVVRFSDVYQMQGDTVRVFLAAQRFQTTAGVGPTARFAFETAFDVVRAGEGWRVAREGRRIAK